MVDPSNLIKNPKNPTSIDPPEIHKPLEFGIMSQQNTIKYYIHQGMV